MIDHKPLVTILGPKKGVPTLAATRLQRWSLILSAYFYDIEFRSTKEHSNVDMLSRLPFETVCDDQPDTWEPSVFNVSQLSMLPVSQNQLRNETKADPVLSQVLLFPKSGWPSTISIELKPFFTKRTELTVQNNCLMWGIQVIVPEALKEKVLAELHTSHLGMSRMKSLARSHIWWLHLDEDIETLCKSCSSCLAVKSCPAAAPLHPWSWPMNVAVYVSGKQAQQKSNHDNTHTERVFEIGQSVMVKNCREGSKWVLGVIIENTGPVSYVVKTLDGSVWHRHVDQIREYVSEQMSASRNLTSVPQSNDEYGPTLPLHEND